jgi:hypothetical protein
VQLRLRERYSKAIELATIYEEAPVSCYESDGDGGFYVASTRSRLMGRSIQSLLRAQGACFGRVSVAFSEATRAIGRWREPAMTNREDVGYTNGTASALREALANLREAIWQRDTSVYWLRSSAGDRSDVLVRARETALGILDDPNSSTAERERATDALNSNNFLWMGVLSHECSCPGYWLYGACKHTVWATMLSTGQTPPANLDPRPLASRRRPGRPRRATNALRPMSTSQVPLI